MAARPSAPNGAAERESPPSVKKIAPVGGATPTAAVASALTRTGSPKTGVAGENATYTPATTRPTFNFSVALPGRRFASPLYPAVTVTSPNCPKIVRQEALPSRIGSPTQPAIG